MEGTLSHTSITTLRLLEAVVITPCCASKPLCISSEQVRLDVGRPYIEHAVSHTRDDLWPRHTNCSSGRAQCHSKNRGAWTKRTEIKKMLNGMREHPMSVMEICVIHQAQLRQSTIRRPVICSALPCETNDKKCKLFGKLSTVSRTLTGCARSYTVLRSCNQPGFNPHFAFLRAILEGFLNHLLILNRRTFV